MRNKQTQREGRDQCKLLGSAEGAVSLKPTCTAGDTIAERFRRKKPPALLISLLVISVGARTILPPTPRWGRGPELDALAARGGDGCDSSRGRRRPVLRTTPYIP